MKYTDDTPRMVTGVQPAGPSTGPVFLSNHRKFGFNVRHFFQNWEDGTWRPTKKGIGIVPLHAPILVEAMVEFMNEVEVTPGIRYELVAHRVNDGG